MVLAPAALLIALAAPSMGDVSGAGTIPAFARRYRTSCSTCHTAAPKLNVMGEAFRLNGYRFPVNELLLREEEPVPLGEDPWRDLWPRAIWPGELPATTPLALRIQTDVTILRDAADRLATNFRFPHEVYLLAGASLGEHVGAFLEIEWSREGGVQVEQAKIHLGGLLPGVPDRAANLWIGLQRLYPFTFADPELDGAGRQPFAWQAFRVADLTRLIAGEPAPSLNQFSLTRAQPALEVNGLPARRLSYAVGVSQGAGGGTADNNRHKDLYYKVRYKLGGLALDGTYDAGGGPVRGGHGQLLDRSLVLEHFGYFGREPASAGAEDSHREFGVSARLLAAQLDLGAGYVWGRDSDPWGAGAEPLERHAVFAKGEYLILPWLIPSLKLERFVVDLPAPAPGATVLPANQTRIVPGLIALIRQNLRLVVEADVFLEHETTAAAGRPAPSGVYARLDLAF